MGTVDDPGIHEFARNFFSFAGQRFGETVVDAGIQADEIEEQMKNGELEGAEQLTVEPKLAQVSEGI